MPVEIKPMTKRRGGDDISVTRRDTGDRMNEQAQQGIAVLQAIGKMTERVLSNPARTESSTPAPILEQFYDSTVKPSLLDIWRSFDSAAWTVDRLEGAVYRRNVLTPEEKALEIRLGCTQLPDDANFQAVVICVMRTIKKRPAIKTGKPLPYLDIIPKAHILKAQIAQLIGSNIGDLIVAFTGHVLSCEELLGFEAKRHRAVRVFSSSPD